MSTNFFPIEVYSSNHRLYSSHPKVKFARNFSEKANIALYAVLSLNDVRAYNYNFLSMT
ncbi:hypothetical protein A5809_000852 [Enterococcus faecium]|nr:hypothetical protein A5809_000852 [Enterococcus faecium]